DAVTFTSSSTVSNFMSLLESRDAAKLLKGVTIASIGPITSDTARSLGIEPDIEADPYTIPGLVDALVAEYEKRQ
ncbi:MAG: HemD protein, partial [Desulfobacteraceae bacterium]|nr:HemD protein [Desulfobacteraceae bacterium]